MTNTLLIAAVRLRALLAKEFRQLLRDGRMRFFVVVPPLIQLIIFGYAATFDIRSAEVAVVDRSGGLQTRALLQSVAAGGQFRLTAYPSMRQASGAMDRGTVRAVIQLPADYPRQPAVQIVADGSDSNSAQLILGQLNQAVRDHVLRETGVREPLRVEERAWFNPNLDDRDYFVPGIIANVVLVATMILTAMTVVRERELGTLERLLVTPLGRFEFLIGKMLPVACVGLFDVLLVSAVAVFWFEIPFRGSFLALLLGSALFFSSTLGLGLLISTFSRTQMQAVLLAFFLIMPAVILSGFAFPIRNMPEPVQLITWLDPLRYYLVVVHDVFLKGGGVTGHGPQFLMMAVLGVSALGLSAWRLRRG